MKQRSKYNILLYRHLLPQPPCAFFRDPQLQVESMPRDFLVAFARYVLDPSDPSTRREMNRIMLRNRQASALVN
jgi:hypothetical protein